MTERPDHDLEARLRAALRAESERAPVRSEHQATYVAPVAAEGEAPKDRTARHLAFAAMAVAAATLLVVGVVASREDDRTGVATETSQTTVAETTTPETTAPPPLPTGEETFGACDDYAAAAMSVVGATGPAVFGPAPDQPPLPPEQLAMHWPVAEGSVEVRFRPWANDEEYDSFANYGASGPSMPGESDFTLPFRISTSPDESGFTQMSPNEVHVDPSFPMPSGCERPLISVPGGQSSVDVGGHIMRFGPESHATTYVDVAPTEVITCESITGIDHPVRSGGPVPGSYPTPLEALQGFFATPDFQSPHDFGSGIPEAGWSLMITPDGTHVYGFPWVGGWGNLAEVRESPDGWYVESWASAC